ncbi:hypothetical protein KFK09_012772 [Dendrobium nobile]|uniref:ROTUNDIFOLIA like 8 n=2 Tax=Dendrobium TaxID=37818 RepID=A0A8T3BGI2_DENNO|nr:hypothetical protein KFK09_012772 [Dendrobium nobile]PKU84313.1 hypothetical protein MA16_Dca002826 [Dendrobium catenatum]
MELSVNEKLKLAKKGNRKASAAGKVQTRERRPSAAAGRSFARRCASLVKEQRARFYIMRRCVVMLICWRDLA